MAQAIKAVICVVAACVIACSLQGCGVVHTTGAWESRRSYLQEFHFVPAGQPSSLAILNSCELPGLPDKLRCNGNGVCMQWNTTVVLDAPAKFCRCYVDWADPECRTKRKSQTNVYLLSYFLGFTGADRFYLGDHMSGFLKLSTLGGCGFWWLTDIIRTGSAPVYAENYRVAPDLDHMYFVLSALTFAVGGGYWFAAYVLAAAEAAKRKKRLLIKAEDDFFKNGSAAVNIDAMDEVGQPSKSSWGTPTFIVPGYGSTEAGEATKPVANSAQSPFSSAPQFGRDPEAGCGFGFDGCSGGAAQGALMSPLPQGLSPDFSTFATPSGPPAQQGGGAPSELAGVDMFMQLTGDPDATITRDAFVRSFVQAGAPLPQQQQQQRQESQGPDLFSTMMDQGDSLTRDQFVKRFHELEAQRGM